MFFIVLVVFDSFCFNMRVLVYPWSGHSAHPVIFENKTHQKTIVENSSNNTGDNNSTTSAAPVTIAVSVVAILDNLYPEEHTVLTKAGNYIKTMLNKASATGSNHI